VRVARLWPFLDFSSLLAPSPPPPGYGGEVITASHADTETLAIASSVNRLHLVNLRTGVHTDPEEPVSDQPVVAIHTDMKRVLCLSGDYHLHCFDSQGQRRWALPGSVHTDARHTRGGGRGGGFQSKLRETGRSQTG